MISPQPLKAIPAIPSPVSTFVAGNRGTGSSSLAFSSLVGFVWHSLAQALAVHAEMRECASDGCSVVFVPAHGNQTHCTDRCYERTKKRRQRVRATARPT